MEKKRLGVVIVLMGFLFYTGQKKAGDVFDTKPADSFIQLAEKKQYAEMEQLLKTSEVPPNAMLLETGEGGVIMQVPLIFKAVQMQDLQMFKMLLYYGANRNIAMATEDEAKERVSLKDYLDQKIQENPTISVYKEMKAAFEEPL